ncbi:MAG TPA: hypothetical protein VM432_12850 [Bdellovibrionales bacterium]|nr:hypothetical protein [Bdellovibrionales bacterium]
MKHLSQLSLILATVAVSTLAFANVYVDKFSKIDADHDGKITAAENKEAASSKYPTMDANKDGRTTVTEVEKVWTTQIDGKVSKATVNTRASTMDTNQDGNVSSGEFLKMADDVFKKMDTDQNGSLSEVELASQTQDSMKSNRR